MREIRRKSRRKSKALRKTLRRSEVDLGGRDSGSLEFYRFTTSCSAATSCLLNICQTVSSPSLDDPIANLVRHVDGVACEGVSIIHGHE